MKRTQAAALIAVLSTAAFHAQADELAAYPGSAPAAAAARVATTGIASTSVVALGEAAAYPGSTPATSHLTRAEVMADVEAARRTGALPTNEAGLAPMGAPRVRAATVAGRTAGAAL